MVQQLSPYMPPNAPKQRQLRVAELLRHELCAIFARGNLRDPGLAGHSITVSEVRVSADFHIATAYVSLLGGDAAEPVLAALRRAAPYLGAKIARAVRLRKTPKLKFIVDPSFEKARKIDDLLRHPRVVRDLPNTKPEETSDASSREK